MIGSLTTSPVSREVFQDTLLMSLAAFPENVSQCPQEQGSRLGIDSNMVEAAVSAQKNGSLKMKTVQSG
jgi:hypothetical protein